MLYTVAVVPFVLLYLSGGTNTALEESGVPNTETNEFDLTQPVLQGNDTTSVAENDPVESGARFLKGPLRLLDLENGAEME